MKKLCTVAAAAFLSLAGLASAHEVTVGAIGISAPWARATAGMARNGGAFMTLTNTGKTDDTLLSAESDVAEKVELHTHIHEGDIMKMRQVESIPLPAGATVEMKPGSLHVMFVNLKEPLKQDDDIAVTLRFEKAGEVVLHVKVEGVGAMTNSSHVMGGTGGGHMKH